MVWSDEMDTIIRIVDEEVFKFIFRFKGPRPTDGTPLLSRPTETHDGAEDRGIPAFQMYDPHFAAMSPEQKAYFAELGRQIDSGTYPDVAGNISYLFLYSYILIERWEETGFERLHKMLTTLCAAYFAEDKFAALCGIWASECLLGAGRYDDFLATTEPDDLLGKEHVLHPLSRIRCDVLYHLGRPANPVDLLKMSQIQLNEYTRRYPHEFREHLATAFADEAKKSGPWFKRLLDFQTKSRKKRITSPGLKAMIRRIGPKESGLRLFGIMFGPDRARRIKLPVVPIQTNGFHRNIGVIAEAIRNAENLLRDAHGVPRIGEGWVSETELFHLVCESFTGVAVEQHGKPNWLGRQHLDIWIPEWKVAVEYHGEQHFRPIEFFGGEPAFRANQERDQRKEQLCRENGVVLIVAREIGKSEEVLSAIRAVAARVSAERPRRRPRRS